MPLSGVIERPLVHRAIVAVLVVLALSAFVHLLGGRDLLGDAETPLFGLVVVFAAFDDSMRERPLLRWVMVVAAAILVVGGIVGLLT